MDVVADTSVLLAVVLNEPEKEALVDLTSGCNLVGPVVIPWEVGNAFSAMFKRKQMSLKEAQKAFGIFQSIPIRYLDVGIPDALRIASEMNIYAYDAYFLLCAEQAKAPMISLDRRLVLKARQYGVRTLEVEK